MRILYSHRIQSRDGQGVHLDSLVAALRADGHEVLVVGPSGYGRQDLGGAGGRGAALVRRWLPGWAGELAELAYNAPAYLRLLRAARTFRPDVIYERANLFHLAGMRAARSLRLPFLLEVNSPLAEERARFGNLRLRGLAARAERTVWRRADRVLPVTEVLAGHIRRADVPDSRIVVVPNGIDLHQFPARAEAMHADAAAPVTLGFIGFMRPWHGLESVVRAVLAWQGKPDLRLIIAGDGPARADLERLAATDGAARRITFTGIVPREQVPGLLAQFDIALQPASVAYASPLKVFEYMAAGRAIVAPDQPNLREVLTHERTALLFDPDAPDGLWPHVRRLIDDPSLRLRLGTAARAEVERRELTWAGNARRVVGLAGAALAEHAMPRASTSPHRLG